MPYEVWAWGQKDLDLLSQRFNKNAIEMHCGKCTIQEFWGHDAYDALKVSVCQTLHLLTANLAKS